MSRAVRVVRAVPVVDLERGARARLRPAAPGPVPPGKGTCRCGRVVRLRSDGTLFSHAHCPYATPREARPLSDCCGETLRRGRCSSCGQ